MTIAGTFTAQGGGNIYTNGGVSASLCATSAQLLTNGTVTTVLNLSSNRWNNGMSVTNVGGNTGITVPVAGYYFVYVKIPFNIQSAKELFVSFNTNGATCANVQVSFAGAAGVLESGGGEKIFLNAGQYITATAAHNNTTNTTTFYAEPADVAQLTVTKE